MPSVAVGPDKLVIDLPQDIINRYQSGELSVNGVKDYVISNGLAQPDQIGLTNEAKANPPVVSGRTQAAMIGMGREARRLGSEVTELAAQIGGQDRRVQEERDFQTEQARLAEPVKSQFPKSSFVGEMLTTFAVPGGKVAQLGAGIALGGLEGETLGERVFNASVGAVAGLVGQKVGDMVGAKLQSGIQKFGNFAKARSRSIMQELNIPMTLGERGSPTARFFERIQSTLTGSKPLQGRQIRALNKLALESIGESGSRLDDVTLSRAHTRIGQTYERVGREVKLIPPDDAAVGGLIAILDTLDDVGTDSSSVLRSIKTLERDLMEGRLTGRRYLDLRSKFGRLSRQLWRRGDEIDATYVDEMIQLMDDGLARVAPEESVQQLVGAGRQWRFLAALRRGSSIDAEGNININALNRSLTAKFPGYDVGKGTAGDLGRGVRATREVVRPFRSSGTAERMVGTGVMAAPILTPQNAARVGVAAAAPFAGGGAGAQLGGNLSRELALLLAQ